MTLKRRRLLIANSIGVFVIGLDHLLKQLAILNKYLSATYNQGIAFGINIPYLVILLANTFLLLAILLIFLYSLSSKKPVYIFQSFILAGGISNFFDRVFLKAVVDYWYIPGYSFFNIADVAIVFGVVGWSLILLKNNDKLKGIQ